LTTILLQVNIDQNESKNLLYLLVLRHTFRIVFDFDWLPASRARFESNGIKGEIGWRDGLGAGPDVYGLDHLIFVNLYTFPWHIMAIMLVHLYDMQHRKHLKYFL